MKFRKMMVVSLVLGFLGCGSPEERVAREKAEAAKEIGKAEVKVDKVENKMDTKILNAEARGQFKQADELKVEKTEKVADAKEKVADEKVEATKEITDAEQKAGAGGDYTHQ